MIFNTDYDYKNQSITGYEYLCLSLQVSFTPHKESKQTLDSPYEPGYIEIWEVKIKSVSGDFSKIPVQILEKIENELIEDSNFLDTMSELISEELADSEAFYLSEKYDREREENLLKD